MRLVLRSAVRSTLPARARFELFRLRQLGLRKAVEYARLERAERRRQVATAGHRFAVEQGRTIVLAGSTVPAVRSHWVDYGHSIKELQAFRRLAPGHHTLFDAGAAEGIFSAAFCALTGGDAWAFEPSPVMYPRLTELCAVNADLRIRPHQIALGERPGRVRARRYSDGQFSAAGVTAADTDEMVVTTLDAVAGEHGCAPDMLKIDVEGMELAVLRGARRTLAEHVRTVFVEVHYHALAARGESMAAIQQLLGDAGFELCSLELRRIADLCAFAASEPELIPGYTIVIARRAAACPISRGLT